jgi:hypothetical protein
VVNNKYRNIVSFAKKRLCEVSCEEEVKSLNGLLDRVACMARAEAGDANALIELSEQILGIKND